MAKKKKKKKIVVVKKIEESTGETVDTETEVETDEDEEDTLELPTAAELARTIRASEVTTFRRGPDGGNASWGAQRGDDIAVGATESEAIANLDIDE